MSKKKNTLQDLDDFLKQQAASLVTPETLTDTAQANPAVKEAEVEKLHQKVEEKIIIDRFQLSVTTDDPRFRKKLYDFIIESIQAQKESSPEDKMLINTALYLKSGADWKNVIREYWRER
jgi:hypothetical protein